MKLQSLTCVYILFLSFYYIEAQKTTVVNGAKSTSIPKSSDSSTSTTTGSTISTTTGSTVSTTTGSTVSTTTGSTVSTTTGSTVSTTTGSTVSTTTGSTVSTTTGSTVSTTTGSTVSTTTGSTVSTTTGSTVSTTTGSTVSTTIASSTSTSTPSPTNFQVSGCTAGGQPCVFPFTYEGFTFSACTTFEFGDIHWCAVSLNEVGEVSEYGECSSSCPTEVTVTRAGCPTKSGDRCLFPFNYLGITYNGCTTVDFNIAWCATSIDSTDEVEAYGLCSSSCPAESTLSSDACVANNDRACVFPFVYNGVTYGDCTVTDNDGIPWCATTVDSNKEFLTYDDCGPNCPVDQATTVTPIVPTTPTLRPGLSNNCPAIDGNSCIFPFLYEGVFYEKCTNIDNFGTYWCAISVTEDGEAFEYRDCSDSCPRETTVSKAGCPAMNGDRCLFPFILDGVTYDKCTNIAGTFYCATEVNSKDKLKSYGVCSSSCPRDTTLASNVCGTVNGKKCIFPFIYSGVTYNACTNTDFGSTFWCATSVNAAGVENSYGICNDAC